MNRILAPVWYPPEPAFAGGFYRARRILESLTRWEPSVIASDTFLIEVRKIRRYPTRALASWKFFKPIRAINWFWSTVCIVVLGLLCSNDADLVYGGPSEILPISLGALIVGKLRGIPVVLCNQNVRDTELWSVNRIVHKSADAIITVSDALAGELRREGLTQPIFVATNGVDDLSISTQEIQYDAIFVGRHTKAKGIFDLLQAWRIVCDVRSNALLVCVGTVNPDLRQKVDSIVRSLHLESNVVFRGPIPERQKWEAYAASRLCLFPSHVEGWGIVPIEAHLAGLRVIAYDLPAYTSTIAQSPGATLVPDGDVRAFAAAAIEQLSSGAHDEAALKRWAQQFTWRAAAAREEVILDGLIRKEKNN